MNSEPKRLLVLSCSRRKKPDTELMPAIDRYNGPAFQVLRKFFQSNQVKDTKIYIISAEFGIIPFDREIPYYDRKMTLDRAERLNQACLIELERILEGHQYQELCICGGKTYQRALAGFQAVVARTKGQISTVLIGGGMGQQLTDLHCWLHEGNQAQSDSASSSPKRVSQNRLRLRGIPVNLNADQVKV